MKGINVNQLLTALTLAAVLALAPGVLMAKGSEQAAQKKQADKGTEKIDQSTKENPVIIMFTSLGEITIRLFEDKAPISVRNFLEYAESGYFDGTIFHRVIANFMIQGGGFTPDMKQKSTRDPIKNEADNGLRNLRGTIAMARTNVVDSATSQFFINVVDNRGLDHRGKDPRTFGYAVFGKVIDGMDVVDKIKDVKIATKGHHQNVPETPVVITSVTLRKAEEEK